MGTKLPIQEEIDKTLDTASKIAKVNASPFFKDKTMRTLFGKKEELQTTFSWFTPKLQLATLVIFVVVNIFAFIKMDMNNYMNDVNVFAEAYELSSDTEVTLFE